MQVDLLEVFRLSRDFCSGTLLDLLFSSYVSKKKKEKTVSPTQCSSSFVWHPELNNRFSYLFQTYGSLDYQKEHWKWGKSWTMRAAFWLVYRNLYQLVCDHSFDATMKTSDGIKVFNFNDLRIFQSAASWPDSSTGRALHRHRRGQGLSPARAWNFQGFFCYCLSIIAKLQWSLTLKLFPSAVQMKFFVFHQMTKP